MILRFVNTSILALIGLLTLTGVYGLIFAFNGWLFDAHRVAGWAFIALIPWKAGIAWRSLSRGLRPNFKRGAVIGISLLLATAVLSALIVGLEWAWHLDPQKTWLFQSAISWHWILALGLLVPFAIHVAARWPRPKPEEFTSRRGALKTIGIGVAGVGGWLVAESLATLRAKPDSPRAISGSRAAGDFTGNNMPITGEWAREIMADQWALTVKQPTLPPHQMVYRQLLARPMTHLIATLDCTTGWRSRQTWEGIPLMALIPPSGSSAHIAAVALKSTTGYAESFLMDEARSILLATHIGGQTLDHWHGFPLRAVVPSRRGWFWVKWIVEIEFLASIPLDFPDFR